MKQQPNDESGFTLVTVMVAVVLVSVAVVALSGTSVYVLSLQTESTVRSAATGIASAYMEEVKTRRISRLASEAETNVNELGEDDAGPVSARLYVRTLVVKQGPAPSSRLVTVTVHYPRGRAKMGKVELVTIIYEGIE